ncbi:serine hydrolase [Leuconostoc holzapfelii]|uniref:Serine hydrolase n=1 Tax=Leuconostoc holzapfelii TaxID=434464 RepID=A0A846ZGQ7_9LACO|nr:serine hydrolase [Leuconostoc holzapfelii]NKZ18465.1 serine hydrolase [Leuconostoc holzapfelii]
MKHAKKNQLPLLLVPVILLFGILIVYRLVSMDTEHPATSPIVSLSERLQHQPDSALKQQWQTILHHQDSDVNIAVYNEKTKQTTTYTNNASVTYPTASIVKVSVLANLLRMTQSDDTSLSPTEKSLAENMIVDSDNDATTTLLNTYQDGYTSPDSLFSALHMTQSKMDPDAWGLTTTTALDQLKLLNALAYGQKSPLNQSDRHYVLKLMANVSPDQAWGISKGIADNATIQLKNGWLESDDGSSWIVNSIGHIQTKDSNYTIAVLTNGNATEADGIDLIESLSSATAQELKAD